MNIYINLHSGISGDMLCGGLINLGVPFEYLKEELKKLSLSGYEITYGTKLINGINCGNFDVICEGHHHHCHRSLSDINEIIENSTITENAKKTAKKIFLTLGEAEAKVHNRDIENLCFHEVGAVDSIIDITGIAICLDYLGVSKIYFDELPSFYGEVKCAHGIIPLPGPAVCELTKGMVWNDLREKGECITPTGAAVLKAMGEQKFLPGFSFDRIGYGCGKRETERGNYLRVFLSEQKETDENKDRIMDIEFNVDDMAPEFCAPLMEKLFENKALDVMFSSGLMKKNRPGLLVKVLCRKEDFDKICDTVFENSTTIGLRYAEKDRVCLKREETVTNTVYGPVRYKKTVYKGKTLNVKPEFEDIKKIAQNTGLSCKEVARTLNFK